MTMGRSKGLTFRATFVMGVEEGVVPFAMAKDPDEERRLLYVAMTRARHRLHLLVPQRFYVTQQGEFGDRHLYGALTRFVPQQLAPLFEAVVGEGTPTGGSGDMPPMPQPAFDIGARARAMWN
jgi:DNA helicase-2/ATP-dependent DNA helicase PcrA